MIAQLLSEANMTYQGQITLFCEFLCTVGKYEGEDFANAKFLMLFLELSGLYLLFQLLFVYKNHFRWGAKNSKFNPRVDLKGYIIYNITGNMINFYLKSVWNSIYDYYSFIWCKQKRISGKFSVLSQLLCPMLILSKGRRPSPKRQ